MNAVSKNSDDLIEAMNKSGKSSDEIAREFNILYKHRTNVPLPDMDSIYKADLRIETRPFNTAENASDLGIYNDFKEFRGNLGKKIDQGNVGIGIYEVDGKSGKIYGFSGYDNAAEAADGKAKLNGFTVAWRPDQSSFQTFDAVRKDGVTIPRYYDSEYKILSEIDSKLKGNSNAAGTITLFTERKCCDSCSDVIAQFSQKYPNIDVEIIHNNNIPLA